MQFNENRLRTESSGHLQYGNSIFQISLSSTEIDKEKIDDQPVSIEEFQRGLPESLTHNLFSKKLPEILETMNDQDDEEDDSAVDFNEFTNQEDMSKFIRSIPKADTESKESRPPSLADIDVPFKKIIEDEENKEQIKQSRVKLTEAAFMSCPPGFAGPDFGLAAPANKNKLSLPVDSPTEEVRLFGGFDKSNRFHSNRETPGSVVHKKEKTSTLGNRSQSLRSGHTFSPGRLSKGIGNKEDISSEDCIGEPKDEPESSYSSEDFMTAMEIDEPASEIDIADYRRQGSEQSGMIKLRHSCLLRKGAVEMSKLAEVKYKGEKPSGFNPQFTNGRVLFQNSKLLLKITNASLSSFGNAFQSGETVKQEKEIIFEISLENIGEDTIEVFTLETKSTNGIHLLCEEEDPWKL